MCTNWARRLNSLYRQGLAAFVLAFTAVVGEAEAQGFPVQLIGAARASADVQLNSGDRTISDTRTIEAKVGDTVVIEYFVTGWDGYTGISA